MPEFQRSKSIAESTGWGGRSTSASLDGQNAPCRIAMISSSRRSAAAPRNYSGDRAAPGFCQESSPTAPISHPRRPILDRSGRNDTLTGLLKTLAPKGMRQPLQGQSLTRLRIDPFSVESTLRVSATTAAIELADLRRLDRSRAIPPSPMPSAWRAIQARSRGSPVAAA